MNTITQVLFWISNSLLVPVIILLLILFVRSLILLGGFYNAFILRRRANKVLHNLEDKSRAEVQALHKDLEPLNHTLVGKYAQLIIEREHLDSGEVDFYLNLFEVECDRDLSTSKLLSKVGPMLGLMGTLISMSPALVGLSTGDIEGMAYNMQIVFATTVVGLVISLVGLLTLQYRQRWYAEELSYLELMANKLCVTNNDHSNE